jgi:cob(I)alamin adenosyltransferase
MESIEVEMKDVAEPDQIVSGKAGTGQTNKAWKKLAGRLFSVQTGEPDCALCTTARWVRRLQRRIARPDKRRKVRTAKRPVIHAVVWR